MKMCSGTCKECNCHWKIHCNYDPVKELPPPPGNYTQASLPPRPQLMELAANVAADVLLGSSGSSRPSNGPMLGSGSSSPMPIGLPAQSG